MMFPLRNSSPRHHSNQGNANVKVVVRVRPLNETEQCEKYHIVTEAISDHMLVFDPKIQNTSGFLLMSQRDINRRRFKDLKYAFDYVFGPSATNKDVFEKTTKGIVSGVLNGYNCSVFAYGATGAGKTHTMLGNEREPGVIYYTMIDLYRRINDQKDEKTFDVAVSYSEVYNEQVRDLLMPRGNLPIREDKNVGVIITGLSLHKPKTADELLHMLHFGNKNRTQHPTDANAESSRSHAVFQVFVNQRDKSASVSTEVKMAKMCLVDLAGSERANHSTNCGARFREGANINRSLLALGNVINALADNKFKGHIPYRDSKLTRLLKDSLGGNCQTVMIAAVSPSSRSFEDTYNTLRYADRAKHIRADVGESGLVFGSAFSIAITGVDKMNTPLKKNVMSIDFHIANYKKYVKELEKENQELRKAKQKLADSLEKAGSSATPVVSPILRQFQERLKDLFKKRKHIRKAQMESEGAKRELKWKVVRKEHSIKRVQHLTASTTVIGKHKRVIERMNRRIVKEEQALKDSSRSIEEHDNAILNTYTEISSTLANGQEPLELLELNIRIHTIEANLYDSHMYLAFVKKMARAQERQSSVNERLVSCLIQLVKKQHDILHSQDLLSSELKSKYEQCCYLVEERGVAWTSPVVEQERSASKYTWDENEEFCISDIIDIQIPKLHMQAFQGETPSKVRAEGSILQPPQRVLKPMSAVKPAARVMSGQFFSSSDRVIRPSSSPSYYTGESGDCSNSQYMAGESLSEKESTVTCLDTVGMNAIDALNVSLDMCPKRRGSTPVKASSSPQRSVSASGISFGTNEPSRLRTGGKDQEKPGERKTSEVNEQNASMCLNSNLHNNEWGLTGGSKTVLWGACSQPLVNAASDNLAGTLHNKEINCDTGHLNNTFQIQKPALASSTNVDGSRKCSLNFPSSQPQSAISRSSMCLKTSRCLSSDRVVTPQKSDLVMTDGRYEGSTAHSPVSRHQSRLASHNHTPTAWTPPMKLGYKEEKISNAKRPSIDFLVRQAQNKTKLMTYAQNRTSNNSPIDVNRPSSPILSGKSVAAANPKFSSPNSPASTDQDERQKSDCSTFCVNSNNVNCLSASAISPKSYADVVKSPVVTKFNTHQDFKTRPTATITHWINEPSENIMKTPDFSSNQCNQLVISVLKKPISHETLTSSGGTVSDVRQPLSIINTNTVRHPVPKSSSYAHQSSISDPSGYGTHRPQLKVRPDIAKIRQNRALSTGPYSVLNRRQQRYPSSQEQSGEENKTDASGANTRPSYMQPTIARAQKMMGIGKERPFLLKARNSLAQRTVTSRQPFNLTWNKAATVTDVT